MWVVSDGIVKGAEKGQGRSWKTGRSFQVSPKLDQLTPPYGMGCIKLIKSVHCTLCEACHFSQKFGKLVRNMQLKF